MQIYSTTTKRTVSVLVSLAVLSSILPISTMARANVDHWISVDSIDSDESSVSLNLGDIDGAVEYVAFEEVTKNSNRGRQHIPVYRGSESSFSVSGMEPGEVSRLRVVAIDDEERILARAVVRTTSKHPDGEHDGIQWVANEEVVDIEVTAPDGISTESYSAGRSGTSVAATEDGSLTDFRELESSTFYNISSSVSTVRSSDTLLKKLDSEEDPVYNWGVSVPEIESSDPETQTLEKEIANVEALLTREVARRIFRWNAFIEDEYVSAPFLCGETWEEGDHYFGGDNRGFSTEFDQWGTSRVSLLLNHGFVLPVWKTDVAGNHSFDGWSNPTVGRSGNSSPTVLYAERDGMMVEVDSKTASREYIDIRPGGWISETSHLTRFDVSSPNPLCSPLGIFDSPTIDMAGSVLVTKDENFEFLGSHTRAPSHEIYLDTITHLMDEEPTYSMWYDSKVERRLCLMVFENQGFPWLALPGTSTSAIVNSYDDLSIYPNCTD